MSIKAKTKAFIAMKNINLTKMANEKGIAKQNLSRTCGRDTLKIKELLELCAIADCRLSIVDNRTNRELINYNKYDIAAEIIMDMINGNNNDSFVDIYDSYNSYNTAEEPTQEQPKMRKPISRKK